MKNKSKISGVGLGFRRDLAEDLMALEENRPTFVEFAPENWMGLGGYWRKKADAIMEKYPVICHGLSLSIGSPEKLDMKFLKRIKTFLNEKKVHIYSEHLSFSKCDNAHLFDLFPIPFREDAVKHVAHRIRQVQDYLEMPLAIENVSYYATIGAEMSEAEFISAIVNESNCNLLLDVNNVYVNAFNHSYNAKDFISSLPLEKVAYVHIAGHEQVSDNLIIDTHGEAIVEPVFELFDWTLDRINEVPVLLERDFNIPSIDELIVEMTKLNNIIANSKARKVNNAKAFN